MTNTISLLSFSCYIQDGVVKIKLSLCISKSLSAITFSVLKVFDFNISLLYCAHLLCIFHRYGFG